MDVVYYQVESDSGVILYRKESIGNETLEVPLLFEVKEFSFVESEGLIRVDVLLPDDRKLSYYLGGVL